MDPVSALPAIASLLAAIATSFFLVKIFGAPPHQGRFATIDGLRGYLALFVFLHHACTWYFYLRTGTWSAQSSKLYELFGVSSVEVFFMITGFLFFSKIIEGRTAGIDWTKLFISRFMRLVPLYLLMNIFLFIVIACLSKGVRNEPIEKVMREVLYWLGFTILGNPNLNGVANTYIIVAGVTWSLPYEWFFYFSLPLLALAVRVIPPTPYIVLGVLSVLAFVLWQPDADFIKSFLSGITAAFLVRSDSFRRFATGRVSSFLLLAGVALAGFISPSEFAVDPFIFLSIAFVLVACGNSLFGVLLSPVSRTLGELAYGIYLLHGIILFVTFTAVVGVTNATALSPLAHWLLIVGVTPALVLICFIAFRLIERPAMRRTSTVTAWLRERTSRTPAQDVEIT